MKLLNFELEHPSATICLKGLGHEWDLHNHADFGEVRLQVESDSLRLTWYATLAKAPWGNPDNQAAGCRLTFFNLIPTCLSK